MKNSLKRNQNYYLKFKLNKRTAKKRDQNGLSFFIYTLMKLKRYIQFIKESLKEDIEDRKLWKLSEDDITDYMLEITDAGYYVEVQFGFSEKVKQSGYKNGEWVQSEKDAFTDKVKSGDEVIPAYWISINKAYGRKIKDTDVSSTFQFACSIIQEEANVEISIHDQDGDIGDVDGIEIKGGFFYTDNWNSSEPELLEASGDYIAIFAKSKETVIFTEKELIEYYGWSDAIVKEDKVYVELDIEDMADILLSRKDSYKDILLKGQEDMYDNYYNSDYQPDIPSMIQYTLSDENNHLLIKAMIKEVGGLENMINHIGDECSDEAYENVKGKSEEEVINYLLKERFYDTLKQLCKNSEICQEVRQTIGDWEMNAHVDDNYQTILDEFDEIVEKEFTFTKEKREVTKYWTSKDAEGNQTRKEYQELDTFYTIPYNNDWISNEDGEKLKGNSLADIFKEWCGEQYFNYEMKPYFSDSGDVDSKALNREIKGDLERYLK